MQTKEDNEPFGIADTSSNEVLLRALHAQFPDHGLLAEEKIKPEDMIRFPKSLIKSIQESRERGYCWVIDPLDGTVDFKNKTDMFGVHLGLTYQGISVLGVNYYPVTGNFYVAIKGKGAHMIVGDNISPIHVSDTKEISELRFAKSTAFLDPTIERIIKDYSMPDGVDIGSMGLKICKVADGTADIYLNANKWFGLWDSCSGEVIVMEAGGVITDMNGNRFNYKQESAKFKQGVLVTNGQMHDTLLEIVNNYLPSKE